MLALREYAAGRLGVSFDDLIERGILAAACFGLTVVAGEEIRMSILDLDESEKSFRMLYESGHGVGRKKNFSACMPIVVGGQSVAVLNVVSTEEGAFFKGDLTYIELLGALIALAWDIRAAAEGSSGLGTAISAEGEN